MSSESIEAISAKREKAIVKTSVIGIITNVSLRDSKRPSVLSPIRSR